ncbi:PAS domain S-box protein [Desulfonatronum parangueonense]
MWTHSNGQRLKFHRSLRGLTQDRLAVRLETSKQHLGEVERGRCNPSLDLLAKACRELNIDPASLFVVRDGESDRPAGDGALESQANRLVAAAATWSIDLADGRTVWSRAMYRLLGVIPSRKPSLKLFLKRLREQDAKTFAAFHQKLLQGELPRPMTCLLPRKNGRHRTLHVHADLLPGNVPGEIGRACAVFLDVTAGMAYHRHILERQESLQEIIEDKVRALTAAMVQTRKELELRTATEAVLRHSEATHRAVAEDTPVMICRYTPDFLRDYVNKAYCDYFGASAESLRGTSMLEMIQEADRAAFIMNITRLTPISPVMVNEYQVLAPGGELRWQRWTDRALFGDLGAVVAYQGVGEDITERRRVEDALRESLARYDDLVAKVPVGVYSFWIRADGAFEFEFVSDRWCEIHQLRRDDALADTMLVHNLVHPDERAAFDARNLEAFRERKPFFWEGRCLIGCELRWLRVESTPTIYDNGDIRWSGVTQDVTGQRRTEKALRECEKRLKALQGMQ